MSSFALDVTVTRCFASLREIVESLTEGRPDHRFPPSSNLLGHELDLAEVTEVGMSELKTKTLLLVGLLVTMTLATTALGGGCRFRGWEAHARS